MAEASFHPAPELSRIPMPRFPNPFRSRLVRTATLACAATLAVIGGAALAGVTPATAAEAARAVETEVILFVVPLVALMAAITTLALRMTLRGGMPGGDQPASRPLHAWSASRR